MPPRPNLIGLINTLYDTVQSPDDWPAGLAAISAAFGAHTSHVLFVPDPAAQPAINVASTITDPVRADEYYRDYVPLDPRWPLFHSHAGRAVRCVDILPVEEMEKSPLIPFLDHPDVQARWCLVTPFLLHGDQFGFVTALRPRVRGTWDDQEVEAFQALFPHLIRIIELHQRLGELSARAVLSEAALHAINSGVVLTDASGRVIFANLAAEAIFRGDAVTVRNRRLVCRNPAETTALHRIIHTTAAARDNGDIATNTFLISRPGIQVPLVAVALPLPWHHPAVSMGAGRGTKGHVALFLLDPTAKIDIPGSLLNQLGCTPAEVRLARELAAGMSLAEFSDSRSLSRETAKSQLAQLLRKTGTSRQGELVAFLNRCFRVGLG